MFSFLVRPSLSFQTEARQRPGAREGPCQRAADPGDSPGAGVERGGAHQGQAPGECCTWKRSVRFVRKSLNLGTAGCSMPTISVDKTHFLFAEVSLIFAFYK